jgi:hypothetical protein
VYGCGIWSLTLREEHRLKVYENRVLRRMYVLRRREMVTGYRRFHSEKLHNLYTSPYTVRVIKSRG